MRSDPNSLMPLQILQRGTEPLKVAEHLVARGYRDAGPESNGYRFDQMGWKPRLWMCQDQDVLFLDLGFLGPAERQRVLTGLPVVEAPALQAAFEKAETAGWAITAARLWGGARWIPEMQHWLGREWGSLATGGIAALSAGERAREAALASALVIGAELRPMLLKLANGNPPLELKPGIFDAMQLFDPDIAGAAAIEISRLWETKPSVAVAEPDGELDVFVCTAGMLRGPNEASVHFPGGYREIAGWLLPERSWVCWRYRGKGTERGVLYDGLVRVQGRWIWIPKPWRFFSTVLETAQSLHRTSRR